MIRIARIVNEKYRYALSIVSALSVFVIVGAQPGTYSVANLHAHNDYASNIPFVQAHRLGFGSIEADIHLRNDTLFVAHDSKHLSKDMLLENAYLQPIEKAIENNNGYIYKDTARELLLLIDLKTNADSTLDALVALLKKHPVITGNSSVQIIITGNQPLPSTFKSYPAYIFFDGNINDTRHLQNIDKIGLFSAEFGKFSKWNGKGIIPAAEYRSILTVVDKAHALHKPIRFWGTPDNINTWYRFMAAGIDYINTDKVEALAHFQNTLQKSSSVSTRVHELYKPLYKVDGANTRVKNVILIIGDGTGLAQWYSGYTGNKGGLNVFNMRSIGLSKTSADDSYITDSGAAGSAMATGKKTNNRFIGVDPHGKAVQSLSAVLAKQGVHTAIITTGDVTDATPAAFYSHVSERSKMDTIAADFLNARVDILMGSGIEHFIARKDGRDLLNELRQKKYSVSTNINSVNTLTPSNVVVLDSNAALPAARRDNFLQKAMTFTLQRIAKSKDGFFVMAEGAQVDWAAHANNMSWMVEEVKDLDKVIGDAMKFVDENKETLLIVTADHETGGLTLLDGTIRKGYVSGRFSTDDHSAIAVPVFAYGPQSTTFSGVYENTEIYKKILSVLKSRSGGRK
ncbi:MAG: alkaline phosphatase [Segetibacter sp.]|nr:alkaline phosphatase [Segetibacter sp.]